MRSSGAATGVLQPDPCAVPRPALLEDWSGHSWTAGVQIERLRDLDALRVCTRNTTYDITILDAATGAAMVRGGRFFRDHAHAVVLGCSLGGAFLKVRGVYCGFSLELYATGARIVTTPVQSVEVLPDHALGTVQ